MRTMRAVDGWVGIVRRLPALLVFWGTLSLGFAALAATDNKSCLECHDAKAPKIEVPAGAKGEPRKLLALAPDAFSKGVHGKLDCVACHTGIKESPAAGGGHKKFDPPQDTKPASCSDCHQRLWDEAKKDGKAQAKPRLGTVVENIEAYRKSFHARPQKDDKTQANASCDGCHHTHTFAIPPADSPAHAQWRLGSAALCGESCHTEQLESYSASIHGKELSEKRNPKAAVCSDCHTAHAVGNTSGSPFKLAVTAQCGNCHQENYKSYKATYHGQVSTLGYPHTAKCFDCHGSHEILSAKNPESKVHKDNRLETCRSCHSGKKDLALAPAGFATFEPHGRTDDFARFPQIWLGFQMMVGLLVGTFAFFWLHTALWFYRELKDRKAGVPYPQIKLAALPKGLEGQHYRRFNWIWRLAHLTFAISLMVLTLTGMPLFYPEAAWAPLVMKALGGPQVAGTIHRFFAVIFAGVFFWHIFYIALRIWRVRDTFRWFGPDSMVPGLQDLKDIIAMFKWFFGLGPRPVFDRWTYWEKFDYWAPFWGVTIIGVSGLVMWLPDVFGKFLPGWVFNVAAIFHGEEAFLAVVFLFTVHFFNNHFRPDKFPIEVVMFTGTMSVEHMRREHALEYQRLVESGRLHEYMVDAPSPPMTLASKVLGFTLIAVGLTLLTGVAIGFFGG